LTSSVSSSVASLANHSAATSVKSSQSMSDIIPMSSPPIQTDVFLYEGVDGSDANLHSREPSIERERTFFKQQKPLASSESTPSFGMHTAATDKASGKKRGGLKKLLSRSSKKKLPPSISPQPCKYEQFSMCKPFYFTVA